MATINNTTSNTVIAGTSDADVISNSAGHVTINADAGNDVVKNSTEQVVINTGAGDDSIYNNAFYVTIDAGDGSDTINNRIGSYGQMIYGGKGNDSIYSMYRTSLDAGDGNDTIHVIAGSVAAGAGNDTIRLDGRWLGVTINGGTGDDTMHPIDSLPGYYYGRLYLYQNGDGNDIITSIDTIDTVQIADGTSYTTVKSGDDMLIKVGNGSIRILNAANTKFTITNATIDSDDYRVRALNIVNENQDSVVVATDLNDTITNRGTDSSLSGGDGDDIMQNWAERSVLNGNNGDDLILNEASNSTMYGGDGNDTIYNNEATDSSNVVFDGGRGDDLITNYAKASTLIGGEGSDTITNHGANADIDGGDDNDVIHNYGENSAIKGGDGDDYILNRADEVAADGGAGNDTIENYGDNAALNGGDGDDVIENYGQNVTINGGKGNDSIYAGENSMVVYKVGDGNDTISGFTTDNILLIEGEIASSVVSGDNFVITMSDGNELVLENAGEYNFAFDAATGALTVDTTPPEPIPEDDTDEEGYTEQVYKYFVQGNKELVNVASLTYEEIYTSGAYEESEYDEDYLIDAPAYSEDFHANFIISNPNDHTGVTLEGGAGNDTYEGGESVGDVFKFNAKLDIGNDVIENFDANDTIRVEKGTYSSSYVSGDDYVIIVKYGDNAGSITLKDAAQYADQLKWDDNHTKLVFDGTTILTNRTNNTKFTGTSKRDYIVNTGNNATIDAKGGNDTIIASDNAERFQVGAQSGNDLIVGFGTEDTLEAIQGSIQSIEVVGDDAIITVKDSSKTAKVTLEGAGSYNFKQSGDVITVDKVNYIVNSDDKSKVNGKSGRDYIVNGGEGNTITGGKGDDTIEGSNLGQVYAFAKGHGSDVVTNFGVNDTIKITSGSSKSYVDGDDKIISVSGGATMRLLNAANYKFVKNGNDWIIDDPNRIYNAEEGVKVSGTAKKDYIENTGENVTIQSGAGDDTIVGSDTYGEVFLFGANDGANVISNFGENDTLKVVQGSISAVETVNNDLLVSITNNDATSTVLLKNAASAVVKQTKTVLTFDAIKVIVNDEDKAAVKGTSGRDYIINQGENVTINSGKGSDTIVGSEFYGETFQFGYTSGENLITNFDQNDTIKAVSSTISAVDVVGDDLVLSFTKAGKSDVGTVTLLGAASLDYKKTNTTFSIDKIIPVEIEKDNQNFTGTSAREYITNPEAHSGVTIAPGAGNDTIEGAEGVGELFRFSYTSGDNVITNFGRDDSLASSNGTLTYEQVGDDVVVTIAKSGKSAVSTITLQGVDVKNLVKSGNSIRYNPDFYILNTESNVEVEGGDGNDTLENTGSNVTLRGNGGNDLIITSEGESELIEFNGIDGNDTITNFGQGDTIKIASGTIQSFGVEGDNYVITVKQGDEIGTITMPAIKGITGDAIIKSGNYLVSNLGNPIKNSKNKTKISGTAFNDIITNSGSNVTINGGGGNDKLVVSELNAEVIQFASDGGQDLVQGFGKNDTLHIIGGAIASTMKVGNNFIVDVASNLYTGSITLEGAAGYQFEESSDENGQYITVEQTNYVLNDEDSIKVNGTNKADYIFNVGESVTIAPGKGNDTIEGSNFGEMFLTASKYGSDVILNFGPNDTLKVSSGTVKSQKAEGDDFVVTLKDGTTMTLLGMGSTAFNYDKTAKTWTVKGPKLIDEDRSKVKVNGTSGNDYITSTGENVTIAPGKGNDTVVGSDLYGDMFLFSYTGGNNVITNFNENDTIKSTSGTISSVETVDNDVIVTISKNGKDSTIRLKNAANLNLKKTNSVLTGDPINEIYNQSDDVKVVGKDGKDFIVNVGENVSIQPGKGADTMEGSIFNETYLVSYTSGSNLITNFSVGDTLRNTSGTMSYETAGDDVIVSINKGKTTATVTLEGAAGYEFTTSGKNLYIEGWNEIINTDDGKKITGTKGKDYIVNTGANVTINAGAGNDIITGSDSYGELFQFSYTTGNDTITNFGLGDTLQMTSGSSLTYKKSGSDYIVTMKKNSTTSTVLLEGAADKYVLQKSGKTLIARPGGTTTSKELAADDEGFWFLDDDTTGGSGDNEVSALMSEVDSDNSVGKLNSGTDASELLTGVSNDLQIDRALASSVLSARHRARK